MIESALENMAVIGAGGKMGSGISLLLLQEVTLHAEQHQCTPTLTLIDTNASSLYPLKQYLRGQLLKFAEKNMLRLREVYKDHPHLISNEEIIQHFITRALDLTNFSIAIESAKNAKLIFEAILEDASVKVSLYSKLRDLCSADTFFLTNTSSIPIHHIDKEASLNHRIIGYHFYNPPAIQKLLEIIAPEGVNDELNALAHTLAKRLNKIVVSSKDVAGFIGNGHFIPEGLFACKQVDSLKSHHSLQEAVYMVNTVTQDFLIRPMGIFQLIDYVGIDVFQNITKTMYTYLPDTSLHHPLIDTMVKRGVLGGQNPDGTQKDGFFQYEGTKICGIYDFNANSYTSLENAPWISYCNEQLGPLPEGHCPWKVLVKDKKNEEKLQPFFDNLSRCTNLGSRLAKDFFRESTAIAQGLVDRKIADSLESVSTVLKTGFFHLYGPDATWAANTTTVGSC